MKKPTTNLVSTLVDLREQAINASNIPIALTVSAILHASIKNNLQSLLVNTMQYFYGVDAKEAKKIEESFPNVFKYRTALSEEEREKLPVNYLNDKDFCDSIGIKSPPIKSKQLIK